MTPASVFLDASAWVAFFNRRDAHHAQARGQMARLLRSGTPLATSTWTTYEAITITRSKLGYGRARRLWRLANDRRIITMIRVDPDIESAALKLFWRYHDKDWGVVDCASLVIMDRLGCRKAFGYDRHFAEASKQRGFVIL
ncbi:MAG: type II toxin-antitoxin system VapC family toxin [Candidatus Binatia bacterium]